MKRGEAGPEYQRQVPRFLAGYEHLLGSGQSGSAPVDGAAKSAAELKPKFYDEDEGEEDGQTAGKCGRAKTGADKESVTLRNHDGNERDDGTQPQVVVHSAESLALAKEEKRAGNDSFGDNPAKAISHYTSALTADASKELHAVLYANRSAARLKNNQPEHALADAQAALRFDASWPKAHARLGAALSALQRHSEAVEAYDAAVREEPDNDTLVQEREAVIQAERDALHRGNVKAFSRAHAKRTASEKHPGKDVHGHTGSERRKRQRKQARANHFLSFTDPDEADE